MPDREKVINKLEQLLEQSRFNDSVGWNPDCDTETLEDALALLKAQEPKPARIEGGNMIQVGFCPNCGKLLQPWGAKYCYECGQAVKWE